MSICWNAAHFTKTKGIVVTQRIPMGFRKEHAGSSLPFLKLGVNLVVVLCMAHFQFASGVSHENCVCSETIRYTALFVSKSPGTSPPSEPDNIDLSSIANEIVCGEICMC